MNNKEKKTHSMKARGMISDVIVHVVLALLAIVWVIPVLWIALLSFSTQKGSYVTSFFPKGYTLHNYVRLFTDTQVLDFPQMFKNTFIIAVFSCLISTIFVLSVSYCMSRMRFKIRKTYMNIAMILGLFPAFMSMVAVYYILKAVGLSEGSMIRVALILVYSGGSGAGFLLAKGFFDTVPKAGCTSPQDMDKLKLSLQGYNYGNGYITWAIRKYGGYSAENALQFSNEQAASHGWSAYGDPEYVPHVLRYYSSGGLFAGLFGGSGQIVSVALTQLGNEGGQKFWSWYGFDSHVAWCACFASWCGDQAGLIESGKMPKFSLCDDGIAWFQSKGKWKSRGYSPAPGTLIFFDWNGDGTSDHVGIVEKTEGSTVYTVEGNSSNAVNQRSYDINNGTIMGYGIL